MLLCLRSIARRPMNMLRQTKYTNLDDGRSEAICSLLGRLLPKDGAAVVCLGTFSERAGVPEEVAVVACPEVCFWV